MGGTIPIVHKEESMSLTSSPGTSLGLWSGAAAGAVFAVTGMLLASGLADAIDLSFQAEPPAVVNILLDLLPIIALAIAGWSAQAITSVKAPVALGALIWGALAVGLLALAGFGIDVAGSDTLLGPGFLPDGASVLMPFIRTDAWRHVGLEVGSLLATMGGAWLAIHGWHGSRSFFDRSLLATLGHGRRRHGAPPLTRSFGGGFGHHAGHPL
jgi:hypothetical protein